MNETIPAAQEREKLQMDPKYIVRLAATLCCTCVVVALLLGYVNMITLPNITKIQGEKTAAALSAVVSDPESASFSDPLALTDEMTAAALNAGATLSAAYAVEQDGAAAGYALTVVASGSQGTIEMMVGVDADGAVTGVSIVSNSETPGIGSKVMSNEPVSSGTGVLDQFAGKSAADGTLVVGSNVEAITGATVSSRGVTAGVNAALAVFAALA